MNFEKYAPEWITIEQRKKGIGVRANSRSIDIYDGAGAGYGSPQAQELALGWPSYFCAERYFKYFFHKTLSLGKLLLTLQKQKALNFLPDCSSGLGYSGSFSFISSVATLGLSPHE